MISIQVKEAIEKFKSVAAINAELRRISPIKDDLRVRVWAQWGNVELRESYNYMLAYEKVLKQAKAQLKQQKPTPVRKKRIVTEEARMLLKEFRKECNYISCNARQAQCYLDSLKEGEEPTPLGLRKHRTEMRAKYYGM